MEAGPTDQTFQRQTCDNVSQLSGPDDPGWNDACLSYFKASYRQRLQKADWESEPFNKLLKVPEDPNDARYSLPDAVNDDGIMPNLLNDRLFYLVFYSMARRDRSGWPKRMFLREMYATNPGCLLEFSLKAQSHGHPNQWGLDAVESYLISLNLRSLATFESFLAEIEGRLRDQWLAYPFKSLLEQLRERLHGLRNGLASHCLAAAWNHCYHTIIPPNQTIVDKPGTIRWPRMQEKDFPLYNGLQQYLKINEKSFLGSILDQSLSHLPLLDDLSMHWVDMFPYPTPQRRPPEPKMIWEPGPGFIRCNSTGNRNPTAPGNPTMSFDTAGTGKTTAIQSRIRDLFGFYCVSPNLLPSDREEIPKLLSLVAPNRAFASRDTFSMYDDFEAARKLGLTSQNWRTFLSPSWGILISDSLIAARYELLRMFKTNEHQRDLKSQKTRWLQLQISCWQGNDPFDAAYRFVRLQSDQKIRRKMGIPQHRTESIRPDGGHHWAFDEVQQALGDPLANFMTSEMLSTLEFLHENCFFSGTSLELDDMTDFLRERNVSLEMTIPPRRTQIVDVDQFLETVRLHAWNIAKEFYALQRHKSLDRASEDFPLLSRGGRSLGFTVQLPTGSWEDVEKTLQRWYIFSLKNENESPKEFTQFSNQIKKAYPTLSGRIRWTSIFAEELLRASPAVNGNLSSQDVKSAAKKVEDMIKSALKERIHQFKDKYWINELYWTAIEADVFSMTRIFSDEGSVKLISEGFALVDEGPERWVSEGNGKLKKKIVKGSLREPLAVKAVMEYLRDPQTGDLYDRLMDRFFCSLQLDRGQAGAIGKLAEFVFTAKLDSFLRDTKDEIAMYRRNEFFNILKTAEGKTSGDTVENKVNDIEKYFLVDPDPDDQQKPDGQMDIQKWIKGPRPSNFFFPDMVSGPDLLVFLKIPGTMKRILCAIQYKTGKPEPANTAYIQHALHTLALKPWKPAKYKGPVIHIYMACAVDIDASKFQTCLQKGADWDRAKLRDDDFICYMDRERSRNVWGETCETLLTLMKKK